MAKNTNKNVTVVKTHKKANIIVAVVVSIAALILIAIGVLSLVHVDPMSDVAKPDYYELYDSGSSELLAAGEASSQSKIRTALDDMDFTVMSAILQNKWDYSYNFIRNKSDGKLELGMKAFAEISSSEAGYMIELVYPQIPVVGEKLDLSKAQKIEVDGETVYFDRIKLFITDTNGEVGTVRFYPYIYARLNNKADDNDDLSSESYKVTGVTVRANTSDCCAALKSAVESLKK